MRLERGIGIAAAIARQARPPSPLKRERLHNLHAVGAAETESARIGGGGHRVAPQQQTLRSGPDAMEHAVAPVFAEQVAIAIAQKAARAGTEREEAAGVAILRDLLF